VYPKTRHHGITIRPRLRRKSLNPIHLVDCTRSFVAIHGLQGSLKHATQSFAA
jgi:hypothetical protein